MKGFLLFIGCIVIGFMTSSVKFALLLIVILIITSIVKARNSDKPAPTKLPRRNNQVLSEQDLFHEDKSNPLQHSAPMTLPRSNNQFFGEQNLFHEDKFDPLQHFDPDNGIL
ncbi:hypothetical protein [Shewanella sp. SM96]|uniref:hypothetical protein n=1 Tax=Shewanella TaxID=22 RepID=UPI0021D80402|nr:hypothetical protein [Shewanella sp. SM96]MCU8005695.1 hypothetical protein [Shewanella sp. SM96]